MGVNCYEDGFDAQGTGFAQELGSLFSIGIYVKLEEERLIDAACLDDAGERVGGVA